MIINIKKTSRKDQKKVYYELSKNDNEKIIANRNRPRRIRVRVRAYRRFDGTPVRGYSYWRRDFGRPGRTPQRLRWAEINAQPYLNNWSKNQCQEERIKRLIDRSDNRMITDEAYRREVEEEAARKGIPISIVGHKKTWKDLMQLSNVTTDAETKEKARADAKMFKAWIEANYPRDQIRKAFSAKYTKED